MHKAAEDVQPDDFDLVAEAFEAFEANNLNIEELDYEDTEYTDSESEDNGEGVFIDLRVGEDVRLEAEPLSNDVEEPIAAEGEIGMALPAPQPQPASQPQPGVPVSVLEAIATAEVEGGEVEVPDFYGPVLVLEVEDPSTNVTRRIPVTMSHFMIDPTTGLMLEPMAEAVAALLVEFDPQQEEAGEVAEPVVAGPMPEEAGEVAEPVVAGLKPEEAETVAEPVVAVAPKQKEAGAVAEPATPMGTPPTAPLADLDAESKVTGDTPKATPIAEPGTEPMEALGQEASTNADGEPNELNGGTNVIVVDDMGDMVRALEDILEYMYRLN
ncbi:calphotin-like [Drosophila bipectinata]|uniref:calphotin-like n=1 Tax=Drosophila bipectinata TaxID=42026 RepID=UPI001C89D2A6|nr:uncharacterized protein LOC108133839 [Drosophila bipectinata]